MIKVNGVSKKFAEGTIALSDISFEINAGEIVYILGESGSGKSTLLKIIAGLEDADTGTVLVDDEKITGPAHNLVPGFHFIAHVSQDFKLQPYLRIRENIARKIPYLPKEEKEERIHQLLKLCRLDDKAEDYPRELSGGEQQRICIVVNLANQPEVMLLDEPFSNLDNPMKRALRRHVVEILREEETTAIIISHDPSEALAVADRIIVMENGRLLQFDTPKKIYDQPVSEYAARFLGPINDVRLGKEQHLIRPEKFQINTGGIFDGQVNECIYQGGNYHLYLTSAISQKELLIYSDTWIKEGTSVKFDIDGGNK